MPRLPRARSVASVAFVAFVACLTGCGALLGLEDAKDRPVVPTSDTELFAVSSSPIGRADKIDLLLVIDNSRSMGDKQAILAEAVPDLIERFVAPSCVDENGIPTGDRADPTAPVGKECPRGTPEFRPIVDLHVGVLSSSMGGFGSDACAPAKNPTDPTLDAHTDDRGRLLNRSGPREEPIESALPSSFLAWFPSVKRNEGKAPSPGATPITGLTAFTAATAGLVSGVNVYGCGFSASLESWYHFLVQPDPYERVAVEGNAAKYIGLDQTILQQRADFLRPDSLVAVWLISDADDASLDPLSVSGQGWAFMNQAFPASASVPGAQRAPSRGGSTAPKGTTACATDPGSRACTSCAFKSDPAVMIDPRCQENQGFYASDDDDLAVRFHRMKERFGVEPRYPTRRYVDGLTKVEVPSRAAEHDATGAYVGQGGCRNPLFAKDLPRSASAADERALCDLAPGPRTPDLVYFAVVGGVPQDLLHFDPASAEKSRLTDDDWTKLVGSAPDEYKYAGIDPRMIPAVAPREGRPPPSATPGDNEVAGELRDWDTRKQDLQYSCTFLLPAPLACGAANRELCECDGTKRPPLCSAQGNAQVRAKAYPPTRSLRVARGLSRQGIVSSLCPAAALKDVGGKPSPNYGYRPAVKAILDRLVEPSDVCLAQKPPEGEDGPSCTMLVTLAAGSTCSQLGLAAPRGLEAGLYRAKANELGLDTSLATCVVEALGAGAGGGCDSTKAGWCYVPEPSCPLGKVVRFTPAFAQPRGSTLRLLCTR